MALDPAERDRRLRTEFEAAKWEQHFDRVLAEGGDYKRSLWWRISDLDSVAIAREIHRGAQPIRVLEPASGSGGTSLELARHRAVDSIVLADISIAALQLARTLATGGATPRMHLLQSDAFALPLADATFDLTWNIGVIEHYPEARILELVGEMLRVTRPGGTVLVGIPNRQSIANLKAALLGSRLSLRQRDPLLAPSARRSVPARVRSSRRDSLRGQRTLGRSTRATRAVVAAHHPAIAAVVSGVPLHPEGGSVCRFRRDAIMMT
jgi:SAM-dependent methyltransferase